MFSEASFYSIIPRTLIHPKFQVVAGAEETFGKPNSYPASQSPYLVLSKGRSYDRGATNTSLLQLSSPSFAASSLKVRHFLEKR